MMSGYKEAVSYIEELPKFTKKHPLHHTREFLRRLGDPALDKKTIHVAGTNGKGSVCAYLQAILMQEGRRTGFFTSPHLIRLNERIKVNNQEISDDLFAEIFEKVKSKAIEMEEEGLGHPSYFEFLFGMAMMAYEVWNVEYIILETGLGGRLDCTNCLEHPTLTIITSVSMDHTAILGDTIEEIAGEKAGIIKPHVPVIFDGNSQIVTEVIKKEAEEKQAPYFPVTDKSFTLQEVTGKYIAFSRSNAYDKSVTYQVPFCGYYQVMNAELAIEAAEYLLDFAEKTGENQEKECVFCGYEATWARAIASMKWPGRMEYITEHMVVDGAHNPGAIEAFVKSISLLEEEEPPVIMFSAVKDKDYKQMIRLLCSGINAKAFVVTEIEDERKVSAEVLAEIFKIYTTAPVRCCKNLSDATKAAEEERQGKGLIYCLGSLYLVGMIKKYLER